MVSPPSTPTTVGEASLDVEWAHAIAPGASIVVYDAAYYPNDHAHLDCGNLFAAMQQASSCRASRSSPLSYGIPELGLSQDGLYEKPLDSDFTTPGVTFLAASGDPGIYRRRR